jgi:hypothetical protein
MHASEFSYALFGENGAPNLDGLSINPTDLDTSGDVFDRLAAYARNKANAMRYRLAGDIPNALKVEKTLEMLYKSLPEWARW